MVVLPAGEDLRVQPDPGINREALRDHAGDVHVNILAEPAGRHRNAEPDGATACDPREATGTMRRWSQLR